MSSDGVYPCGQQAADTSLMRKGCPLVDAGFAEPDWVLPGLGDSCFWEVEDEVAWIDAVQEARPID